MDLENLTGNDGVGDFSDLNRLLQKLNHSFQQGEIKYQKYRQRVLDVVLQRLKVVLRHDMKGYSIVIHLLLYKVWNNQKIEYE